MVVQDKIEKSSAGLISRRWDESNQNDHSREVHYNKIIVAMNFTIRLILLFYVDFKNLSLEIPMYATMMDTYRHFLDIYLFNLFLLFMFILIYTHY